MKDEEKHKQRQEGSEWVPRTPVVKLDLQYDPIEILERRLTSGEISIDEFNEISVALNSGRGETKDAMHREDSSSSKEGPVIVVDANNWFGIQRFYHKGKSYSSRDIQALQSRQYTQTINFIPSRFSGFVVTLMDGSILNYSAFTVLIRTQKAEKLNQAFDFISGVTFRQRISQYLSQLQGKGYFQYHDYYIYGNGDIKHKNKTVNIAEAALENGVEFGRKSSFGFNFYYTPDEIWVSQEIPGKLMNNYIIIETKENRDVIREILYKLAKSKGGTVEFVKP
jgi:hypothetical protein